MCKDKQKYIIFNDIDYIFYPKRCNYLTFRLQKYIFQLQNIQFIPPILLATILMIYAYIRVSTDKQTVENQRYEIQQYCIARGLSVDRWIEETASGTKTYKRRSLGNVIKSLTCHDTLICTEISRLGRSLFMIMEILSQCLKKGCRVYTIKDNYQLGDNIESKVLAFAFGLSAEIERTLISQRTREALCRLKKEGKRLGRPKGSKGKHPKLKNQDAIIQELRSKHSVSQICKILHISRSTFYRRGY